MADAIIYCLAHSVRTKLTQEASSANLDLRRIVGHANVLDHLTAELLNLGYERDTDDKHLADAVVVENELETPSGHSYCTDENSSGTEEEDDDHDSVSSESSDDSDSDDDSGI